MDKNAKPIIVEGVNVNPEAMKRYKSLEALKAEKEDIFSHFDEAQKPALYTELWKQLHPPAEEEKKAEPAKTPAEAGK